MFLFLSTVYIFIFPNALFLFLQVLSSSVAGGVGEVSFFNTGTSMMLFCIKHTGKWHHGFGKLMRVFSLSLLEQQCECQSLLL